MLIVCGVDCLFLLLLFSSRQAPLFFPTHAAFITHEMVVFSFGRGLVVVRCFYCCLLEVPCWYYYNYYHSLDTQFFFFYPLVVFGSKNATALLPE